MQTAEAIRVTPQDRLRQVVVTISEVFCVFGTLVGTGVIGTRVAESSGGVLAADATRLAPAGPAFSIWTVIYLGLAAYTVWQWLPAQAARPRQRAVGWLVAASMILNATWLLVTQQGWLWASVVDILLLALVLGLLVARLTELPAPDAADHVLLDGTFGLYLGWVAVATCANIAAAFVASGVQLSDTAADTVASVVLVVAAALGVLFASRFGGRLAVAAAMAWGFAWIAVGRLTDQPLSQVTAITALVAAAIVVAAVPWSRRTPRLATSTPRY